jgi:hypothetical protein
MVDPEFNPGPVLRMGCGYCRTIFASSAIISITALVGVAGLALELAHWRSVSICSSIVIANGTVANRTSKRSD